MSPDALKELLAKVKAKAIADKQPKEINAVDKLAALIQKEKPDVVDVKNLGLEGGETEVDTSEKVEIIREVVAGISAAPVTTEARVIGVARNVQLNAKQQLFNDTVMTGKDVVLIGAAGTGKTTSMRTVSRNLLDSGKLGKLQNGTKILLPGSPGMVVVSFTRKAVNNIRHAVVDELKQNTVTLHKLLEFAPVFYEVEDGKGGWKKTMKFEPTRHATKPLPSDLKVIAFEESSMIGVDLYEMLQEAMPHRHQEIFLGDIQQLPPVFGPAILGFKMTRLPVVELTEVYRQAQDSPIISLAWKLLAGRANPFLPKTETKKDVHPMTGATVNRRTVPALQTLSISNDNGSVQFLPWQKALSDEVALKSFVVNTKMWWQSGRYEPTEDIILCPFNKSFGTVEINKGISQYLGVEREAVVHEVIAGFNKHYLAVGDRVLFDKEDAYITAIRPNGGYLGARPQPPSVHLDRWGILQVPLTEEEAAQAEADAAAQETEAFEKLFESDGVGEVEDRVQASSHVIELRYAYDQEGDSDSKIVLDAAAEINNLLGGYAITVHKSQGSEYERVILVLHSTHAAMVSRELLYTAVTRAKKHLVILCEPDSFFKGIKTQRIKGDTIEQKAAAFMGKLTEKEKQAEIDRLERKKFHDARAEQRRVENERRDAEISSSSDTGCIESSARSDGGEDKKVREGIEARETRGTASSGTMDTNSEATGVATAPKPSLAELLAKLKTAKR